MKLLDILTENEAAPKITWRVNGDNSHTVRIEYSPDRIFVHTNKVKSNLEKIVKDRYTVKKDRRD